MLAGAVAASAALALHAERTLSLFGSLKRLTDDAPVVAVDHALHYYHGVLGAAAIRSSGRVCAYDPNFMAGYPRTPLFDPSANLAELSQLIASGPAAYKMAVFATTLAAPVCVAGAAWLLWRQPGAAVVSLWLTVLYWWVGYPNGLLRSGLVAFLWSAALATLLIAALASHDGRWTLRRWLLCTLLATAGLQGHPTFVIQVLPAVICWVVMRARWSLSWWATAVAGALVALIATWPWWWPLMVHFAARSAATPFLQATSVFFVVDYFVGWWSYRADAHLPTIALLWSIPALAAHGRQPARASSLGLWLLHGAYLAVLTFGGSLWSLTRTLEPVRFQVPLALMLVVLASRGVLELQRPWPKKLGDGRELTQFVAVSIAAGATLLLVARATLPASRVRLSMKRPLPAGLRPEMHALVRTLKQATTGEHRILFEDQLRLWEATDPESTHWTPLLPWLTGRTFIGGLYELTPLPHRYASFGDRHLAGRPIGQWRPDELREFLVRYNIGWVVTWSRSQHEADQPGSTEVFGALPFCRQVAVLPRSSTRPGEDRYYVFVVNLPTGWALRGRVKEVEQSLNRIVLRGVEPDERGELLLSLHYMPGWRSEPPVTIRPERVGDDPVPFLVLRVPRPMREVELHYSPAGHRPWMWRGPWRAW